jgi:hypothetical protein
MNRYRELLSNAKVLSVICDRGFPNLFFRVRSRLTKITEEQYGRVYRKYPGQTHSTQTRILYRKYSIAKVSMVGGCLRGASFGALNELVHLSTDAQHTHEKPCDFFFF